MVGRLGLCVYVVVVTGGLWCVRDTVVMSFRVGLIQWAFSLFYFPFSVLRIFVNFFWACLSVNRRGGLYYRG